MNLLFYDFEVFLNDWLVVIIDPENGEKTTIVNNREELSEFFEKHNKDIWIGYNSRRYDQYILKAILLGMNPKEVNDFIIKDGNDGWQFSRAFNDITFYNYDCMSRIDRSLKYYEGAMGHSVKESSIPFNIPRPLSKEEIQETIEYCTHDVEETIKVFLQKKADFDAHISLITTFGLPMECINKTQAQLSAQILNCYRQERDDEWDIQFVDTLRLDKYKFVYDWFNDESNHDYSKNLEVEVMGVPHTFGWGGLHGCPEEPVEAHGLILHVDVNSFYPSIMIEYGFLSRNSKTPEKYKEIYEKRLQLKKEGKKKEQAPYKIILNGTYGITKDKFSQAYDPRQANNVCINGQLLLLDLLEHLEGYCTLIQSNTDGLIIQIEDSDEAYQKVDDICYEWEERTRMSLGFDTITDIWQKDVNNYIFKFEDGKLERKGAYVKELSNLDYDLAIINEAIVEFLVNKTPIEETINGCSDLKKFQLVKKIGSKYEALMLGTKIIKERCVRMFASKDSNDPGLRKIHAETRSLAKVESSPEHLRLINGNLDGLEVPEWLDRDWYINIAKKRSNDFLGIKIEKPKKQRVKKEPTEKPKKLTKKEIVSMKVKTIRKFAPELNETFKWGDVILKCVANKEGSCEGCYLDTNCDGSFLCDGYYRDDESFIKFIKDRDVVVPDERTLTALTEAEREIATQNNLDMYYGFEAALKALNLRVMTRKTGIKEVVPIESMDWKKTIEKLSKQDSSLTEFDDDKLPF